MKNSSKPSGSQLDPATRLALDRYVLGLWSDRELDELLASKSPAAAPLAALAEATTLDRPRAAEKLREELFGQRRPTDVEKLEALIRQGVDRARAGMPILPELQHDLLACADAVPRDDGRSSAVRLLADLGAVSQVNLAIQSVGHIAESTLDRVTKARAEALAKLGQTLTAFPHLAP